MTLIHELTDMRQRDLHLASQETVDYLNRLESQILEHKGV
jgi:hypothetical protein